MTTVSSRWALAAAICVILVVDCGLAFTSQVALHRQHISQQLLPPTKSTSLLQATVNGESKTTAGDDQSTTTTASGQPGFPLHALFNAAARAAVPKAADNAAGGHDAVSKILMGALCRYF